MSGEKPLFRIERDSKPAIGEETVALKSAAQTLQRRGKMEIRSGHIIRGFIGASFLSLAACGGGGGGTTDTTNADTTNTTTNTTANTQAVSEITDASTLSQAITIDGAQKLSGDIPAPATAGGGTMGGTPELVVTQNSTAQMTFEVPLSSDTDRIGAVFIKLDGSDDYFMIPVDANGNVITGVGSQLSGVSMQPTESGVKAIAENAAVQLAGQSQPSLTLSGVGVQCATSNPPCQGITLTGHGWDGGASSLQADTTVNARVQSYILADIDPPVYPNQNYDWSQLSSHWSQPMDMSVSAVAVGSGDIQVSLTWNSTADIDLHVIEPDGNEIYFGNRTSASGGELDKDDVNGYGPENVFYNTAPPAGTYQVEVHHWSGDLPTNYVVTLKNGSSVTSYSGTLSNLSQRDSVTSFTSAGTSASTTTSSGGSSTTSTSTSSTSTSSTGSGGTSSGSISSTDFCVMNYPQGACTLINDDPSTYSSFYSSATSCSSLGYDSSNSFDFATSGSYTYIAGETYGTCTYGVVQ